MAQPEQQNAKSQKPKTTEYTSTALYTPDISLDSLKSSLQVEDQAIAQASNDSRPKSDDTELDGPQQQITRHFADELAKIRQNRLVRDSDYSNRRDAIELHQYEHNLLIRQNDLVEDFSHRINQFESIIRNGLRDVRNHAQQYRIFRQKHKLSREPHYPTALPNHLSLVVLVLALEGLFNFQVLSSSDSLSTLNAMILGTAIAVANVLMALAGGYYILPLKNHIDDSKRLIGLIGTFVLSGTIFAYNIAIALYRFSLSITENFNLIDFIEKLISSFWKGGLAGAVPNTPEVAVLFVIGLTSAVVAVNKGYTLDDSYPGYGRVHRRMVNAEAEYEVTLDQIRESVREQATQTHSNIDAQYEAADRDVKLFKNLLNKSIEERRDYDEWARRLENQMNAVLSIYREINKSVRDTSPPDYFNRTEVLAGPTSSDDKESGFVSLTIDHDKYIRMQEMLQKMRLTVQNLHLKIQDIHKSHQDKINSSRDFADLGIQLDAEIERPSYRHDNLKRGFSGFKTGAQNNTSSKKPNGGGSTPPQNDPDPSPQGAE